MNIGVENIVTDNLNGYLFSLMGMLIVFIGLVLICCYIIVLPHFLAFAKKRKDKLREKARRQIKKAKEAYRDPQPKVVPEEDDISEVLVAIATALHLEHSFLGDNQKYTWKEDSKESNWKIASQVNHQSSPNSRVSW